MTQPKDAALRIGILGCANIARQFARDVAPSTEVRIVSVGSRNPDTAAAFAAAHGIGRHHGSYESLLSDAEVDAVYLPLPNSLHAEWAIKAVASGKHVLCEKPLALGREEARAMFDAAKRHGVMLLEAYPYCFQPQTRDMLALLGEGAIGDVRSVQSCFGFTLANPQGNIRMNPELGGGALLDAGSYPLSLIRLAMGCAPHRVRADATWADTGVDISLMATLFYADGRRAQLSCAMDVANHRRATIMGSRGTIETEYLNHTSDNAIGHPHGYQPSQMRIRRGTANTVPFEEIHSAVGSGFRFAAEAFAGMVARRDFAAIERASIASLDNASTMEAMARSARLGQAVDVPDRSR
ncbi:MAG TPA: Gfo/Idh/MocA family oxidoreductase [Casimicrobiaceae bacterium]|nr:Gfo/Idh/MocA family oxidoreductase [Casimicrobiaceae bacterium]